MIFFDPCSYTYHFNNRILGVNNEVRRLYSSVLTESFVVKIIRVLKFYFLLIYLGVKGVNDVVVFNISPLPLFDIPLLLLLKFRRNKIICILHNIDPTKGGKFRLRALGYKSFLKLFDVIIVHSNIDEEQSLSIDSSKILRANIPISISTIESSHNGNSKAQPELKLLFIGRIEEYKGLGSLIPFFTGSDLTAVKLQIVGKPTYNCSEEIEGLKSLGFRDFSYVNNYISDEEYVQFLANSDVVLLPYVSCSGSAVFMDAIEKGKVILASDIQFFELEKINYSRLYTTNFYNNKFFNCYDRLFDMKDDILRVSYMTTNDYLNLLK